MDAIILAAGKGKRINNFNSEIPKSLLQIKGRPFIFYTLDNLVGLIDRLIVVVNHLSEKIENQLGNNFKGLPIIYISQKEINGTGSALFETKEVVSEEFLVLNGDCYYAKEDILKIIKKDLCILAKEPNTMASGGILIDPKGDLKKILEKEGKTNLCNAALYKLNKKIFECKLRKSIRNEYEITDLINQLADKEKIEILKTNVWGHITTGSDIININKFFEKGKKRFSNFFVENNEKILLQLRGKEPWLQYPNQWQFLGGMIEEGETPEDCLIREMKEELNLNLKKEDFNSIGIIKSKGREDYLFKYNKKLDISNIIINEGQKIKYINKKLLSSLRITPPDKKIADYINILRVPLSKPFVGKKEINAVKKVLESGILSLGKKLDEFEEAFAKYIGTKYAVAVSSGTSALHLCMKVEGIKKGDEVLVSPFSFIASSNCIIYEGGKPVFVDIDENTLNIDPKKIEEAITEKTKAIVLVHIFGQSAEMNEIQKIANKYSLKIIEDSCEALGAEYDNKKIGSFENLSVFSFYPNKQMTTGEGAVITTNDKKKYDSLKKLINQGRSDMGVMEHDEIGYNYRLNELSCAMGVEQLKKINFIINDRRRVAEKYNSILKKFTEVKIPYENKHKKSWFVYVIRLKRPINRDKVMDYLGEKGIGTRPYFPSIHLQPIYKKLFGYKKGDFSVAEKVSETSLALPFFTGMTNKQISRVCAVLRDAIDSQK